MLITTDLALRNKPINRIINNLTIKRLINCDVSTGNGPFKIKKPDFINMVTNLTN